MTFRYQVLFFGDALDKREQVEDILFARLNDLGVGPSLLRVFDEAGFIDLDSKSPIVAIFFGYPDSQDNDHPIISRLLANSITIIPCIESVANASKNLPKSLRPINALHFTPSNSSHNERLVSIILENLRLIRADRRIFISYRRAESQSIAIQLYEHLDASGFDVFLDTRSVPYASDFQSILWHRMADSDIVLLLETPEFRTSHWTMEELSKANTTNIQILHLLWPRVKPDPESALSEFLQLRRGDFRSGRRIGELARLKPSVLDIVVERTESLRARALAARHRSLVDSFCDQAREEHVKSVSVQSARYISLELTDAVHIAVVPLVGVPRADRYHQVEQAIQLSDDAGVNVWLLYDERGILQDWLSHIDWLDGYLPVRSVQISKSASRIREELS